MPPARVPDSESFPDRVALTVTFLTPLVISYKNEQNQTANEFVIQLYLCRIVAAHGFQEVRCLRPRRKHTSRLHPLRRRPRPERQ